MDVHLTTVRDSVCLVDCQIELDDYKHKLRGMPLFVLQPRGLNSPTEETPNMIPAETSTWEG